VVAEGGVTKVTPHTHVGLVCSAVQIREIHCCRSEVRIAYVCVMARMWVAGRLCLYLHSIWRRCTISRHNYKGRLDDLPDA